MTDEVVSWPPRLRAALHDAGHVSWEALVVPRAASTQDAARAMGLGPGNVLVAVRQTAGRGRLGRAWRDDRGEGIAATFVTDASAPPRLALACAVGCARAAEALLGRPVGIKWPNDIVVDRRKLAGILIEQSAARAYIGIGINVAQTAMPPELADRATSLALLGRRVDRVEALEALLPAVVGALRDTGDELAADYAARDCLARTQASFRVGGRTITGMVLRADPESGLLVQTANGEVWLPAGVTTRLDD
jgi:BirA family biotin operon repressor/biotin-[acetyl-CoA-carboxylase] ligase